MKSVDLDGDQRIQYREFTRKLERHGLKNLTPEENLVFNIVRILRRVGMLKSDLFRFINKDGEGLITRKDMRDFLKSIES
jgi:Ca2+-binding EF-hand superfamily protein